MMIVLDCTRLYKLRQGVDFIKENAETPETGKSWLNQKSMTYEVCTRLLKVVYNLKVLILLRKKGCLQS